MPEDNISLTAISDFIFTSKYARFLHDKHRRETWTEAVDRVQTMHLKKFRNIPTHRKEEIIKAFDLVHKKVVAPSMRSLQFGGDAINAQNSKGFNCAIRHIDSLRSFSEVFHLLLNGCGVGFGLNKKFLGRLPNLVNSGDKTGSVVTYTIEDTIEGWANSVEALLQCYFHNTPYTGKKLVYDYSKIRRKGSLLKTTGGKAPGHLGLRQAHERIKALLDYLIEDLGLERLRSIDAYDILMHTSDAVLSGGVRRAATAAIFEKDDELMLNSKTYFYVDKVYGFDHSHDEIKGGYTASYHVGRVLYKGKKVEVCIEDWELTKLREENTLSWFRLEPQRARANNSVLIIRGSITFEEFKLIVERTKEFGEPGFVWADDEDTLYNPCQPKNAILRTPQGLRKLEDVNIGDTVWSKGAWTVVTNKWSTGVKSVYEYRTTAGAFLGTEAHKLVQRGVKTAAQYCDAVDIIAGGPQHDQVQRNPQDVLDGLMLGDGTVHKASNDLVYLNIGEDDVCYLTSEVSHLLCKERPGVSAYAWEVSTTIAPDDLVPTYDRQIPDRFFYGSSNTVAGFLRGLYSANGSVCGNRITLKAASFRVIEQAQLMLSMLGIRSYYTTNKSKCVEFDNGAYTCKESYDLNVTVDRGIFMEKIGFLQEYKCDKVDTDTRTHPGKTTYDIISSTYLGDEEVFDITVDNDSHTYWTGGCNVSNCFEVGFIGVTPTGECGCQFCNLCSMNGRLITTYEEFREAALASVIIGTCQAAFTHLPFLSPAAKELTEGEALLGCSITGMFDNPDILLNPEYQRSIVEEMVALNEEWAEVLGIKPAARITVIKPEGTASLVFQCASGIHPHHAPRYFRRVQMNKTDNVYNHFRSVNPHACEESVWSAAKTDDVVTFPIEVTSNSAKFKADLTALQHLAIIKSTQENWVLPGTTKYNKKPVTNNVSCTVIVDKHEWDEVEQYIFDNQNVFAAVSLLGKSGDKDYPQAPMEAITTEQDEAIWKELVENFKHVDYTTMVERTDNTALQQEASCVGGACEIV